MAGDSGTAAAICTTGAFVPQLVKIRRQGGEDLSYVMLVIYLGGVLLWLSYGVLLHAQAVIWANATATILVMASIILKATHPQNRATLEADALARAEHPAIAGVPALVSVVAPHAKAAAPILKSTPNSPSSTIDRFVSHAQSENAKYGPQSPLERNRARRRPRIAVDMDEVIADAFGKMLRAYNERTGSQHHARTNRRAGHRRHHSPARSRPS